MIVLIVEDDPIIAMAMEDYVSEHADGPVITVDSRADAFQEMRYPIDLALLDIDVTNGKTFDVAAELQRKGIPFVFISASDPASVPADLRDAPFLPKPFRESDIRRHVEAVGKQNAEARRDAHH